MVVDDQTQEESRNLRQPENFNTPNENTCSSRNWQCLGSLLRAVIIIIESRLPTVSDAPPKQAVQTIKPTAPANKMEHYRPFQRVDAREVLQLHRNNISQNTHRFAAVTARNLLLSSSFTCLLLSGKLCGFCFSFIVKINPVGPHYIPRFRLENFYIGEVEHANTLLT